MRTNGVVTDMKIAVMTAQLIAVFMVAQRGVTMAAKGDMTTLAALDHWRVGSSVSENKYLLSSRYCLFYCTESFKREETIYPSGFSLLYHINYLNLRLTGPKISLSEMYNVVPARVRVVN